MNASGHLTIGGETAVDDVAAELAQSAYVVVHAHLTKLRGAEPPWLELKLALWNALRRTVKKWDLDARHGEWRQSYLNELADATYRTMLSFCMRESFQAAESSLLQTFQMLIDPSERPLRYPSVAVEVP